MVLFTQILFTASAALEVVCASPAQVAFDVQTTRPRGLHGRFLHITDMHPDPYYTPLSSKSTACHRKKPKKKKNQAGYFGTPSAECDSPFRLTNYTLDYLNDEWAQEIDFVIWTGDNARHDNDRKLPRTPSEIYNLNRAMASKMERVFLSRNIPVVPSLGNNDIWPHNILTPGPNSITNQYSSIWKSFIPFPYLQVFQRGAYYAIEVIPNQVAAISLNTLYFYDSNKVLSGCSFKEPNDPGNLQLDWLEVQLMSYRDRGIQVWITGHVPPSPGNYFPECYVRYVELALRFQDTVLGHLYGHMNVDHFFFLEAIDLQIVPEAKGSHKIEARGSKEEAEATGLFKTLLREFSALPKKPRDAEYDNYVAVNVAPAVVPNPYVPAFRIFSYNISGFNDGVEVQKKRKHGHRRGDHGNKTTHCRMEEYKDTWKCHLDSPWFSDADAPSRRNQRWTPLGYAQYYMPNVGRANKTHLPEYELEYLTYRLESLHPDAGTSGSEGGFLYPIPLRHLPEPLRSRGPGMSRYTPYGMADLTIPSWMLLGHRLAKEEHKKLRKRFRKYMSVVGQ